MCECNTADQLSKLNNSVDTFINDAQLKIQLIEKENKQAQAKNQEFAKKIEQLERLSKTSLPIFPHVENDNHRLAINQNDNDVTIEENQTFSIQGKPYNTSNYTVEQRTFACDPAKTYHLRFRENAFVLCDLADKAYNPDSLDEADVVFDSTYDDMLIARISNNSCTSLINANNFNAVIHSELIVGIRVDDTISSTAPTPNFLHFEFARMPVCSLLSAHDVATATLDNEFSVGIKPLSRYKTGIYASSSTAGDQYNISMGVSL